jgi:DNA repair protein RadC
MKYAYSIKTSRVKEQDFPYAGKQITCTSELLDFAKSLQSADVEKMLTIYMDTQNQVICIQVMNGTVNYAVVYPREIIRHALLSGATGIILAHNHPSEHVKPSDADIKITRTLQEVCKHLSIEVHDHIIIGENKFYSFREEGILTAY